VKHDAGRQQRPALQAKVLKGQDLNPHLSGGHSYIKNPDGLFAEWQVHHFHLGTGPDPKNPKYVTRTKSLVFAMVDDTSFYAINVFPPAGWEDIGIIEAIHRNWPDAISKYRVRSVTPPAHASGAHCTWSMRAAPMASITSRSRPSAMPLVGGIVAKAARKSSSIG
jgi:hypothetical protein